MERSLKKELTLLNVFCVATGAMISSGLFILPGLAFAKAGPAVILSYMIAGIFVNPIVHPAVPKGRSLIRTSYMATHTDEQLDWVLEEFAKIGKKLKLAKWSK